MGIKPLAIAVLVGFMTLLGSWLWLREPSPRLTLPMKGDSVDVTVSQSGKYLAMFAGHVVKGRVTTGKITIWDLQTGTQMWAMPYDKVFPPGSSPGYSMAFSPDETDFVTHVFGGVDFYNVHTGKKLKSTRVCEKDAAWREDYRLVTGRDGRLFVRQRTDKQCRIFDIDSGEMVGSFSLRHDEIRWHDFPGGVLSVSAKHRRLWNIPEGTLRRQIPAASSERAIAYWNVAAQGDVVVHIDGKIHIWDNADSQPRTLDVPVDHVPNISPDGRELAVMVHASQQSSWPARLARAVGHPLPSDTFAVCVYDLTDGTLNATFANAAWGEYSPNGRMLLVGSHYNNKLYIYDLPLANPWPTCWFLALSATTVSGLLGLWFVQWRKRRRRHSNRV